MGCYINPPDMTKEEWLKKYGQPTLLPCEVTQTHVPVCLVDNRMFTAAGVGYHPLEVNDFKEGMGGRKHSWWKVRRDDVRKVSDLLIFEERDPPDHFPEEKP